ncbi:MAG TPA: TonB-dependent receptor [Leeuwenhoekiella sp.]|nr:TonB-dependent receptor [Leeuwenhoekiella sp.]HBO28487.1 TonB-dependent receptor [Leeuwenhoekiella sp.]HCQ77932.1 TonB-dependent receptor [Leeuwenhoekiella sp.]
MKQFYFFSILLLSSVWAFGQSTKATLKGHVSNTTGEKLPETYIYIKGTTTYTMADANGDYRLRIAPGTYELTVSLMGYLDQTQSITLNAAETKTLNIQLEEDPEMTLDDVLVKGRSAIRDVQESSYNVVALDAEPLHNTTLDVSQALERVSGVRVRRTGGVGSDYNVMLNGFTGRHVKFFIDGIPMEGFSSAFQLNNIPINLAKRIEVYKGVVPITFGSDALGGAINIVTENGKQNFVDASYSFGSFNTHKSFVNAAYTADSGFTARLTAFQNYSDNDYKVTTEIVDLETSQFTGDVREVRRFHDMYRNYTVMAKVGVVNTSYADELLLGFTYGDEYDEQQHPAYMKIAFGQRYGTSETLMPTLSYRKRNLFTENLNVSLTANYNFGESSNIDDSYRRYNWLGEFIETDAPGEFNYAKTYFRNRNGSANANITYTLAEKHAFTVNNVLNLFSRKSRNEVEPSAVDAYPSETIKNILGVGYKYQPTDDLSISSFYKYYYNKVNQYADPTGSGEFENLGASTEDHGYGLAASYFLLENLQLKSSYEKAYRLPTGRELFGAGNDFELGNPDLKPESSDNFNFGVNYNWLIAKNHQFNIDASFIYRDIKDFIRQVPNPTNGVMQPGNEASVKNRGVDLEMRYNYASLFSLGGSFTYQNLRNKLKYRAGRDVVSTIYNDRIPNMPYLYGNADLTFYFSKLWQEQDRMNLSYNLLYIHEFDYSYESYGGIKVPTQISHDLAINYSLKNGKYNISLECRNILNEDLYDNFSLQKPGRSFAVKLRYFLDKFN